MSSKRFLSFATLLVILSMLLAACGGETATNTPVAPAATDTPAPAAAATDTTAPATATEAVAASPSAAAGPAVTATETLYAVADCSYGGGMKSIQAVDDTTVKFTLCSPDPAFPAQIAFASLGIQSAKHLQETGGGTPALLEHPIGTGAYVLKEWVRGDHLTLEANPNYWGDAPKTKTIIFKWNKEATARLTSLKAGEADGIDNPDTNDFAAIQADTTLKLFPRDALNVFYLGMNTAKAPLDNEKVRQAIAMAIDKTSIVKKFYPAGSTAADYFTPCAIPGGCEGTKFPGFDLA